MNLFYEVLINNKKESFPAIIFLHGRGANEYDLLSLSDFLGNSFNYFSIRAPFPFDFGGYTWYEILDETGKPNEIQFEQSFHLLHKCIDEIKQKFSVGKIILFGFSMGTAIGFALSLSFQKNFFALIANSGYIPKLNFLKFQMDSLSQNEIHFFISHGIFDDVLPIKFGRESKQILETYNAKVEYKEYNYSHQLSEESLLDIKNFLEQKIK